MNDYLTLLLSVTVGVVVYKVYHYLTNAEDDEELQKGKRKRRKNRK